MLKVPKTPLHEPVATVVNGHTFTVDTRYVLKDSRILGKGSFGVVCTAYDSIRKIDLAIKRIRPYANDDWDSRHTLREIRLLKLLGPHPNVRSFFPGLKIVSFLFSDHHTVRVEFERSKDGTLHDDGSHGLRSPQSHSKQAASF